VHREEVTVNKVGRSRTSRTSGSGVGRRCRACRGIVVVIWDSTGMGHDSTPPFRSELLRGLSPSVSRVVTLVPRFDARVGFGTPTNPSLRTTTTPAPLPLECPMLSFPCRIPTSRISSVTLLLTPPSSPFPTMRRMRRKTCGGCALSLTLSGAGSRQHKFLWSVAKVFSLCF
jgi:hypothetical protein